MKEKNNLNLSRLPPSAVDLEKSIIGTIFNNPNVIDDVLNILKAECFYAPEHQLIFKAVNELVDDDKLPDMYTTMYKLQQMNLLEQAGSIYYLTVLNTNYGSVANLQYHCYIVLELYIKRELITLFENNASLLYNFDSNIMDIYNAVYDKMESLFSTIDTQMISHINSTIERTLKEIKGYSNGTIIPYIKCGDPLWDNVVFPSPGNIILIAAPRSAGKTRYLIHIIRLLFENNNNLAALWYSIEDSDSKILRALASSYTGLTDAQMQSKNYTISDKDYKAIENAMNRFSKWDISIVNEQNSINEISRRFNRFITKREDKINLLIIDNFMLISDLYQSANINQTSIEDATVAKLRSIMTKATKNNRKCIIIFLHHMTKEMESKMNIDDAYRPKLSYLKGSTRIADISTTILLINKPGMHKDLIKRHSSLSDIKCIMPDNSIKLVKRKDLLESLMIVEVAKNRDGEISDNNAIIRYIADFGKMKFNLLKTIK